MKRFYWLLALPYVVQGSPQAYLKDNILYEGGYHVGSIECGLNKEECEDLAVALNEAHEWRLYPNGRIDPGPQTQFYWKDSQGKKPKFDYKSACGQDDCGKEP